MTISLSHTNFLDQPIKADSGNKVTLFFSSERTLDQFVNSIREDNKDPQWNISVDENSFSGKPSLSQRVAVIPAESDVFISGLTASVKSEIQLSAELSGNKEFETVELVLNSLNLSHLREREPFSLSGGEKLRTILACALVTNPKCLILAKGLDNVSPSDLTLITDVLDGYRDNGGIVVELCFVNRALLPVDKTFAFIISNKGLLKPKGDFKRTDIIKTNIQSAKFDLQKQKEFLTLNDVEIEYKSSQFSIGPITLNLKSGDCVALVGENGSGKSTLLKAVADLIPLKSGSIVFNTEKRVVDKSQDNNRRWLFRSKDSWSSYVLYNFQDPSDQFYCHNLEAEIIETAKNHKRTDAQIKANMQVVKETFNKMKESSKGTPLLKLFLEDYLESLLNLECEDVMSLSPFELSLSKRRQLSLASAFIDFPAVLLLDEPTAHLNIIEQSILAALIKGYTNSGGICLFVTHDHYFAKSMTSSIVQLVQGHLNILNEETGYGHQVTSKRFDKLDDYALSQIESMPQAQVLELGCGHGRLTNTILKARPDAKITAIDKNNYSLFLHQSVHFIHHNLPTLPHEINGLTFDVVISQRTLHYLSYEDFRLLLKTLYDRINPGGYMFLSVSGLNSVLGDDYPVSHMPIEKRFHYLSPEMQDEHAIEKKVCLYTKDELEYCVRNQRFVVDNCWQSDFGNIKLIARKISHEERANF